MGSVRNTVRPDHGRPQTVEFDLRSYRELGYPGLNREEHGILEQGAEEVVVTQNFLTAYSLRIP